MLTIVQELHERLAELMARRQLGPVPPGMIDRRRDRIFIGKASKEHRAMAILYDEMYRKHEQLHKEAGMKFGVNAYVPPDHYRLHVLIPLLQEMMEWSIFRAYPEQKSAMRPRFDRDWNMFGQFPDDFRALFEKSREKPKKEARPPRVSLEQGSKDESSPAE